MVILCVSFFADYYKFWVESIDSFADENTPIILVGTRGDKLSKQVSCKKCLKNVHQTQTPNNYIFMIFAAQAVLSSMLRSKVQTLTTRTVLVLISVKYKNVKNVIFTHNVMINFINHNIQMTK